MPLTLIEEALFFIIGYEVIVGTGSLYMLWIYMIKPRMKFKNMPINKVGTTVIADIHLFQDGIYAGTYNNFNATKFIDDTIAKITGVIPKGDVNSIIETVVKRHVADQTEKIIVASLDVNKVRDLLTERIDAEILKQLGVTNE